MLHREASRVEESRPVGKPFLKLKKMPSITLADLGTTAKPTSRAVAVIEKLVCQLQQPDLYFQCERTAGVITDLPERGKASLKDFLQKIEEAKLRARLGTKPGAAVTQTYSDNQAEVTF